MILLLLCAALAQAQNLPNPFPANELVFRLLPNGLRLVVREDHSLPVVAMVVVVRSGSAADGKARGSAHYLEHLIFQGTQHFPTRLAPQEALERVGGVSDAITGRDMTRVQATVASEQLPLLVRVLANLVLAPTLSDDAFTGERRTILSEIQRAGDSPVAELLNYSYLYAYTAHPYRFRPTGSLPDVLALTANDVRQFTSRWYVPNNMSVVLVGDVTPARAAELVEQAFGAAKNVPLPAAPAAEPAMPAAMRTHIDRALPDTYQALVFPSPAAGDLTATAATDVLMTLLTDGAQALLASWWARDRLTVSDFGGEFTTTRQPGRLVLWSASTPAMAPRLRRSTQELLRSLAAGQIADADVARAKQQLATRFILDNETYSQQAATLAYYEGMGSARALSGYLPAILAVTPAQVRAATPTRVQAWVTLGERPKGES